MNDDHSATIRRFRPGPGSGDDTVAFCTRSLRLTVNTAEKNALTSIAAGRSNVTVTVTCAI